MPLRPSRPPGVLWACLGYFCVYCVYQGATYTTPVPVSGSGTDANVVNVVGLIRTYGIGLLAGPVIGAIAAKAKSSKTIMGCFVLAIVVLGAFIVLPQDPGLSIMASCLVVVFGFATYGAFSIGSRRSPSLAFRCESSAPPLASFPLSASCLTCSFTPGTARRSTLPASQPSTASSASRSCSPSLGIIFLVMCIRATKKHAASQAD